MVKKLFKYIIISAAVILSLLGIQRALAATILFPTGGGTGVGTITGIIKGNGTAPFSVATAGTDYLVPC